MFKKISVFVLFFSCLCELGAFNNKTMRAEDLHVFTILQNAKAILMEDILQSKRLASAEISEKIDVIEQASLVLVDKEITLLREIVDGLNNNSLIFEFRFIAVCNFFSNMDLIEPRNVRAFERKIIRFDNSVQKYSRNKRGLMSVQEANLCKKIMYFDKIWLTCFLRHDFYNIDLYDEIVDTCFFRPVEFMGNHPVLTMSAVLVIASVAFYLYGYPWLLSKNKPIEKTDDKDDGKCKYENDISDHSENEVDSIPVLENQNPCVSVDQIKRFTQSGLQCAVNSVFSLIAVHEGNGDVAAIHKLINDKDRFRELTTHWSTLPEIVRDGKTDLSNLDTNHVDAIIADYNHTAANPIPVENLIVVADSNALKPDVFEDFNAIEMITDGIYPNDIPGGDPFIERQGKCSRLMAGHPIYVVVNTAQDDMSGLKKEEKKMEEPSPGWVGGLKKRLLGKPYNSDWVKTKDGHWFSMMFIRDESAKTGVRVVVADSWFNSNQTNGWHLNRMHHILLQGS